MADEPQTPETEQADDTNPATENQTPVSVVTVYDAEGREHFAAPTSKWVVDGLADGTLTEQPPAKTEDDANSQRTPSENQAGSSSTEEVPSGAEAGSASHDPEPGTGDGAAGSGDGAAEEGATGGRRRAGKA